MRAVSKYRRKTTLLRWRLASRSPKRTRSVWTKRATSVDEPDATVETGGRMDVEHAHRHVAVVAEAVRDAQRHEHEGAGRRLGLLVAEEERHLALDDVEG